VNQPYPKNDRHASGRQADKMMVPPVFAQLKEHQECLKHGAGKVCKVHASPSFSIAQLTAQHREMLVNRGFDPISQAQRLAE
jgi:hypothetical protein